MGTGGDICQDQKGWLGWVGLVEDQEGVLVLDQRPKGNISGRSEKCVDGRSRGCVRGDNGYRRRHLQ